MASAVSIAMRKEAAVERLLKAATLLSQRLEVEPLEIPASHKDAGILHAVQLEMLATWLEGVAHKTPKRKEAKNAS